MTDNKFSVESDFVDSFLSYFLLESVKEASAKLVKNGFLYASCVNFNSQVLKFSDCSLARDEVSSFIEGNEDFSALKSEVASQCTKQVLDAHKMFYIMSKETDAFKVISNSGNIQQIYNNLGSCVTGLNNALI
mmetsp:Transcript_20729/g.21521  ORF Transcript_20729/g.21521 Transcript_20729/m.21521 type:complete len:133 (-) Transcript_20729:120-518(-)